MPSMSSSSIPGRSLAWTLTTPSLPTAANASPIARADLGIGARDRRDARDLLGLVEVARLLLEVRDDLVGGVLDPAPQRHRVGAGGDVPDPVRTIACASTVAVVVPSPRDRRRRLGDLLQQPRALPLGDVLQLDLAGDSHAVVRDERTPLADVEHGIPALGAERHRTASATASMPASSEAARFRAVGDVLVLHRATRLRGRRTCRSPRP